MEKLLEYLEKNITIFTQAPIAFVVFFFLSFGLAFVAVSYIYKERIEGLKQQVANKEDFINDYRQRLHLVDKNKTAYSTMTNQELKTKTNEVIPKMRSYLEQIEQQNNARHNIYRQKQINANSDEESKKLFTEYTSRENLIPSLNSEYSQKFQSDAILLRDEIASRLPKDKGSSVPLDYEHPTNPIGLRLVINDLERMNNLLPK